MISSISDGNYCIDYEKKRLSIRSDTFRCAIKTALIVLALCCFQTVLKAQDLQLIDLPDVPIAKIPARKLSFWSQFKFDHRVLVFGAVQGSIELYDGFSTSYALHNPLAYEGDPAARLLLGKRPTWPMMIAVGALEDLGTMCVHQRMRHSQYKIVRRLAPVPSLLIMATHVMEGSFNWGNNTDSCTIRYGPGYITKNGACFHPGPNSTDTKLTPLKLRTFLH